MQNLTDDHISPLPEQEAYGLMFEQAGFGIAQVSLNGQWLFVNQSLCEILGCRRAELLSKTLPEVTRFDDIEADLANCRRLLSGESQSFSTEKRHLRADGRVVWLKAMITLVRDDATGEPSSYLAVVEDLTPHKKEVHRIQVDGERRFRILAEKISDVFITLNPDLACTYWNKAAESLTGMRAADALGRSIGEIFGETQPEMNADKTYREVLARQQARRFTAQYRAHENVVVLDVAAYPSKEGISIVARDVSERQRSEEMLRRIASMVEFNDDAILSITPEGHIASWNRGAEKLYGYSADVILGKEVDLLVPLHLRQESQSVCRQGLAGNGIQGFETQRLRQDGAIVDVSLSISPIVDANGSVTGISSIARDISERKRSEKALKRQAQFNELMTRILTRFTTCTSTEVDESVIAALQYTAEFIACDHAYVLILAPDRASWNVTHEWCAPHVRKQAKNYRHIPRGAVPWSEAKVMAGEVIRISTADEYPAGCVERQGVEFEEGRQSILLVPIRGAAGMIAGAVGFDSHGHAIAWSDDDVAHCQMVGDAIATVLERQRAEQALRRSEEKFSKAFEASPAISSIVRVKDRRYLEVNRAFEKHTGFLRSEVLGRSIAEVKNLSDLRSLNHAFEKALAQGSVRNTEARLRTKEGEALTVLLSAEIIEFDGQSCVLTVAEDITERKQAEEALRESEERFRVMADSAPIMMWMAGTDKGCTDFNRGWLEFTGRSLQQEMDDGWISGVHPADLERCVRTYHAAFDASRPFTMEYRLRRHDGEYRWIADTGVPRLLMDGNFVGYIGCCVDIDDQKQAELARTDLSRRLMTAQEAERTRIARELHDGIGQSLALLGIQMQRAGQPASLRDGKKNLGIPELCGKVKEIGAQVSRLSHQLHSSELEFLGLAVAVKGLCREFSEEYRIKVNCVCTGVPAELNSDVSLCFLRVVQEALHNIAKHSRASTVEVEVTGTPTNIALAISDNGVGFEMSKVRQTAGLGMVSMRERMHLIGGEFTISSEPGRGTKILARAPLPGGAL